MTNDSMVKIAIFGAAPDTSNLGVSALLTSIVSGLKKYIPSARIIVFDNGRGVRKAEQRISNSLSTEIVLCGIRAGHRYYRSENLTTISTLSHLGTAGAFLNPTIRLIDSCNAILDISGGDSFSDIYGQRRFISIVRPKQIAIKRSVPLFLLPQTYGPYNNSSIRETAVKAVIGAEMAWARDGRSFDNLKNLLGERFDSKRHRCGVDIAFGLQSRSAESAIGNHLLHAWVEREDFDEPLVGFNISGLIFNNPEKAKTQYRMIADYRYVVRSFLLWLLECTNVRIVLVPHVVTAPGHYESDIAASQEVYKDLTGRFSNRIVVSPSDLDQSQVKWVISKFTWFCGTRMHATIAALSSGVATAGVAYSDKMKGVFELCDQGDQVVDPRMLNTEDVIDSLKKSYHTREIVKKHLNQRLPAVIELADTQMKIISNRILTLDRGRYQNVTDQM